MHVAHRTLLGLSSLSVLCAALATACSGSSTEANSGANAATGGQSASTTVPVGGQGGATTSSSVSTAPAGGSTSSSTGPLQIMPLGDSITGSTCYPQLLSSQLIAAGHTNFAFVGANSNNQDCSSVSATAPALSTEGHPGYLVTRLTTTGDPTTIGSCGMPSGACGTPAELTEWAAKSPDIVLMHFGTNDTWNGIASATILASFETVIAKFQAVNPNVDFWVSKIIANEYAGCSGCHDRVDALNALVTDAWAAGVSTGTSAVRIVDHHTSFTDMAAYTNDGVHPNPTGANIMATVTFDALVAAYDF